MPKSLSEQVRELEAKLERGSKVYYDIADATLPSSTGPQDIIAEIRRLREAERAAESRLAQARAGGAREGAYAALGECAAKISSAAHVTSIDEARGMFDAAKLLEAK